MNLPRRSFLTMLAHVPLIGAFFRRPAADTRPTPTREEVERRTIERLSKIGMPSARTTVFVRWIPAAEPPVMRYGGSDYNPSLLIAYNRHGKRAIGLIGRDSYGAVSVHALGITHWAELPELPSQSTDLKYSDIESLVRGVNDASNQGQ